MNDPQESVRTSASREMRKQSIQQTLQCTDEGIVASTKVLLGFSVFAVCFAAFPDAYIVKTTDTLSVPLAGPASFLTFCLLAPAFLITGRIYIELLLRHWRRLAGLPVNRLALALEPISGMNNPFLRRLLYACHNFIAPVSLAILAYKALAVP